MKPRKPVVTTTEENLVVVEGSTGWKQRFQNMGLRGIIVTVTVHAVFIILAIFFFAKWIYPPPSPPPNFTAQGGGGGGNSETAHKVQSQARRASTASDQSRKIASSGTSDFTLPEMTETLMNPALPSTAELGAGKGGGSGGGSGTGKGTGIGSGTGAGHGAGTGIFMSNNLVFFGNKALGKRIVFVLDYSISMKQNNGKRLTILQDELRKTLTGFAGGPEFQVVLFAGPSWLPGDFVDMTADRTEALVRDSGQEFHWKAENKTGPVWECKEKRKIPWQQASSENLEATLKNVIDAKPLFGTSWEAPLNTVLEMTPPPEVIFFMTDGTSDEDSMKIAHRVIARANKTKTVINTISMMEPNQVDAMKEMAKKTGGGFSIIQQDGKVFTPAGSAPTDSGPTPTAPNGKPTGLE